MFYRGRNFEICSFRKEHCIAAPFAGLKAGRLISHHNGTDTQKIVYFY
jgi:hypothetical protein